MTPRVREESRKEFVYVVGTGNIAIHSVSRHFASTSKTKYTQRCALAEYAVTNLDFIECALVGSLVDFVFDPVACYAFEAWTRHHRSRLYDTVSKGSGKSGKEFGNLAALEVKL